MATLTIQEPPFPQPFLGQNGQINTTWQQWLVAFFNSQNNQNSSLSPLASPVFTGTPTAPTAAPLTNNQQVATTAYTDAAVAVEKARAQGVETVIDGEISTLNSEVSGVNGAVAAETARAKAAEALLAPIASPTFAGTVTEPVLVLTGATPTVASGQVGLGVTTAATATAGAGTLPIAPVNFWVVNLGGTVVKIPYYAV